MDADGKLAALKKILAGYESLLVAFSGGVDSTLLLAVAADVLGDRVFAVIGASAVHPESETRFAAAMAEKLGVPYRVHQTKELDVEAFRENPENRCYICKKSLILQLKEIAARMGMSYIAHGANVDDLNDFRPGFAAAEEEGVVAPLIVADMTKSDIRALSRQMGLDTWDKPSAPCLATRLPYGTPITEGVLVQVSAAEDAVKGLGFKACRVRHHGTLARIELDRNDFSAFLDEQTRNAVVTALRALGYDFVALDMEGYRQGSMNRTIALDAEEK